MRPCIEEKNKFDVNQAELFANISYSFSYHAVIPFCSPHSFAALCWCCSSRIGNLALCGTLDSVSVWNIKQSILVSTLSLIETTQSGTQKTPSQVRCLAWRKGAEHSIAVGYEDGTIRLWDINTKTCTLTLRGHRSAITALTFSNNGSTLVSGACDTDVIVWDIIAEHGLCRLRGHKDAITCLAILEQGEHHHVLSASKDALLKCWDLDSQTCVQTLLGHRSEVWSFAVSPDERAMVSGSEGRELRVWNIADKPGAFAQVNGSEASDSTSGTAGEDTADHLFSYWGLIPRQSNKRATEMHFNSNGKLLFVLGSDKLVDAYVLRSREQMEKKIKRRQKRQKEKANKKAEKGEAEAETDELDHTPGTDLSIPVPTDLFQPLLPLRSTKKITSIALFPEPKTQPGSTALAPSLRLLCSENDNSVHVYNVDLKELLQGLEHDKVKTQDITPYSNIADIELPGKCHRAHHSL